MKKILKDLLYLIMFMLFLVSVYHWIMPIKYHWLTENQNFKVMLGWMGFVVGCILAKLVEEDMNDK